MGYHLVNMSHTPSKEVLTLSYQASKHTGLENRRSLVRSPALPIFFPRIADIHSSLTAVHCFEDGYVGKQPVAWEEWCAEYWLKELPRKHGWVHWPQ